MAQACTTTAAMPSTPSTSDVLASRVVVESVRGVATSDGAGVKLTRLIGTPALRWVDPFLMLDEFLSD